MEEDRANWKADAGRPSAFARRVASLLASALSHYRRFALVSKVGFLYSYR